MILLSEDESKCDVPLDSFDLLEFHKREGYGQVRDWTDEEFANNVREIKIIKEDTYPKSTILELRFNSPIEEDWFIYLGALMKRYADDRLKQELLIEFL